MQINSKSALLLTFASLGLAACQEPTLVTLQPIGAPLPSNAQQTFVDADGCSWWIIGNNSDLRWAPMTNSEGEHVCDGGATQMSVPVSVGQPLSALEPAQSPAGNDDFAAGIRSAIEDAPSPAAPVASSTFVSPPPAPVQANTEADNTSPFFVQVATFAQQKNIAASETLFSSLGYTISSGSAALGDDGLYRLVLGPFPDRASAQKAVEQSFNEGFDDAFPFRR